MSSFRIFVSAISGAEPDITDDNVRDLALLSAEFRFTRLSAAVADYQPEHPPLESDVRLVTINDHLSSHDRSLCLVDGELGRHRSTISDIEAALGDLQRRTRDEISAMQSQIEELTSALAASRQREEEQGQEIRRLRQSNDKLKGDLATVRRDVATLMAGGVRPTEVGKQFAPSVKDVKGLRSPDGIVAYPARQCGGNVVDRGVMAVTCSKAGSTDGRYDVKNITDMESDWDFYSACRPESQDIEERRNNWVCSDFKQRRIVLTHSAIRTQNWGTGSSHLKSWIVETSVDGNNWSPIDSQKDNNDLNGKRAMRAFPVAAAGPCRFIRLVNVGRNHFGTDCLRIETWEVFGSPIE
jgi:hypothetical protein